VRRLLRWLGIGLLSIVLLLIIALGVIYVLSEIKIRRHYSTPADSVLLPTDSTSIAEGFRLAQLRGCSGGCHGDDVEGGMFVDAFLLARLPAPNLTTSVRDYSDAELAGIIRHGVRPDGRSVIAMPSEMFRHLSDADLGRILAYLRSVPPVDGQRRGIRVGPVGRFGLVAGMFHMTAELVRRSEQLTAGYPAAGDSTAAGAYLARTVCTECHGLDLRGDPQGSPDLRIVAGYSPEAFTHLMRTGKALGDRELKLMSVVARSRFVHFTDEEIGNLYRYLTARAARPDSDSLRTR
jgi:mono/diheme cytochrome c family protein